MYRFGRVLMAVPILSFGKMKKKHTEVNPGGCFNQDTTFAFGGKLWECPSEYWKTSMAMTVFKRLGAMNALDKDKIKSRAESIVLHQLSYRCTDRISKQLTNMFTRKPIHNTDIVEWLLSLKRNEDGTTGTFLDDWENEKDNLIIRWIIDRDNPDNIINRTILCGEESDLFDAIYLDKPRQTKYFALSDEFGDGVEVTGLQLNAALKKHDLTLVKCVNFAGNKGFLYKLGLNSDIHDFNASGFCEEGGLYCTTLDKIEGFRSFGDYLYEVRVPPKARVWIEDDKIKVSELILVRRIIWN